MNWRSPKLWISVLSAIAVLLFALSDLGRAAPGPLADVHAREAKLVGFGSCANCHGGWTATMAESCLECHADIDAQISDQHGLHGTFPEGLAQLCSTCHSDHNGGRFQMVNERSFAVAGIGARADFDHERIGFAMRGRHSEIDCRECHEHADTEILPAGRKRFLGLSRDCATCHDDAHEGRMRIGCASCHGQESFAQLRALDHDRHLALDGGHSGLACRTCHAEGEPHSLEVLGAKQRVAPRVCTSCHESPHANDFLQAAAAQTRQAAGATCVTCHEREHTSFRDETLLMSAAQHALTGFVLAAPHDKAACIDCHGAPERPFRDRYRDRKPDRCDQCHEDPHGGQFDTGRLAAQGCLACHERTHFEPHAFTVAKHEQTAFPLTGRHEETDCAKCHKRPEGRPRTFVGTSRKCGACHGDAHDGYFAGFADELGAHPNGTCAACHDTASFHTHPKGGFDHLRYTEFAVTGAHAQVDCETCHVRTKKPDGFGRTFGRLKDRHGAVGKAGLSCITCHTDPHRGSFDKKGRPTRVDHANGCERCHTHTSFRTLKADFDHGLWTGFALRGAHGKARCADCHEPLRRPDAHGRTWGRAAGSRCSACHDDPHQRQFDPVPARLPSGRRRPVGADCARCHKTSRFKELKFNHEIHSRFPLGKRHRGVACAQCHKPDKNGATTFVRYRPLARDCVACHGKQEDPFRRRRDRKR